MPLTRQVADTDAQDAVPGRTDIDDSYTIIDEVDGLGGLDKIIDPFLDMVYPLNRDNDLAEGVIPGGGPHQAVQRPDGSGVVESKAQTRTYGIRLADGTVIGDGSGMWFPYRSKYHRRREDGSGEVRHYDEYDWFVRVPFEFIEQVLDEFVDPDEGVGDFMRSVVSADILDHETERGVLMEHRSGVQVYVGYDSTGRVADGIFGFFPFDGIEGVRAPTANDALDLLKPNDVAAASDVTRQGEVFLVPTDEEADGSIQRPGLDSKGWGYRIPEFGIQPTRHKAIGMVATDLALFQLGDVTPERAYLVGSPLDSHIPREWRTIVDDDTFMIRFIQYTGHIAPVDATWTPQDVVDYVWRNEESFDDDVYHDIREMAGGIQVRGSLRHRANEHPMEMADGWRRATTHDWDVVTLDPDETVHLDC